MGYYRVERSTTSTRFTRSRLMGEGIVIGMSLKYRQMWDH